MGVLGYGGIYRVGVLMGVWFVDRCVVVDVCVVVEVCRVLMVKRRRWVWGLLMVWVLKVFIIIFFWGGGVDVGVDGYGCNHVLGCFIC